MTYWDKVINQNQMDSSLVSELSDLSYRSIGGKRQAPRSLKEGIVNIGTIPFELTPPPDAITKEMIMDYQKEREKPYKDPITGVEYKYIPSAFKLDMPDLMPTLVNDLNLGRPPTNEDVKNYRIERGRLNIRLTKAIKDMKDIEEQIKQSEELINFGRKKPYKKHGVVQYDPLKPAEKTREQAKLADNQGALALAQNDIKQLETDIEQARQNGIDASDIINQNKQIVYDKNKENKENVQKYYNELKSVNMIN